MDEVTKLHEVAIEYFKLNHIPMDVEVIDILCPSDVYYDKDIAEVSLKFLKGLIAKTDYYINLCKRDNGYLFELKVDERKVRLQVEVKLNKEKINYGYSY